MRNYAIPTNSLYADIISKLDTSVGVLCLRQYVKAFAQHAGTMHYVAGSPLHAGRVAEWSLSMLQRAFCARTLCTRVSTIS